MGKQCKRYFALESISEGGKLARMDNATELHNKGIEPTDKRVEIYFLFINSSIPLSATIILQRMKPTHIHRATVFRTINLFEEKELIKRVDFTDGECRYELGSLPHHHHAVCKTCGAVERFDSCMVTDIKRHIKKRIGFRTIDHSFTLFGVCKKCTELV